MAESAYLPAEIKVIHVLTGRSQSYPRTYWQKSKLSTYLLAESAYLLAASIFFPDVKQMLTRHFQTG